MTTNTHNPQEEFEAVMTRALERSPELPPLAIPVDFAARVAASLPQQRTARPAVRVGRIAAIVAMVVLAIVLFVLAPHASPSFASFTFDIELIVLAQLGAIAYWLSTKAARS
jgi:hypothetical protein